MSTLRFAIFGTGFWSRFQLAAWRELEGIECVALYNRTRSKAEALAAHFGIPAVYDNPEELLDKEKLDFIDIITDVVRDGESCRDPARIVGVDIACDSDPVTADRDACGRGAFPAAPRTNT